MKLQENFEKVVENIEKVIIGKREVATLSLVALLAEGHILLEDVPGVGKTMMVRALSKSISADFKRIQFTPDLLPSDVTGVSIYNPKEMDFIYRPGPVMSHIVLADEINRTSPKTQSALLEAMEEGNVTTDGVTRPLPRPFFVMATQNPIEFDGTYQLPEAQLDRFLFKLKMGYPSMREEIEMLSRQANQSPIANLEPVMDVSTLIELQDRVKEVYVDDTIKQYIVEIVNRTRKHDLIYLGASPRGSVALMRASQALALIQGRDFCIPDDVQYLALYVLSHRIMLKPEARYEGKVAEDVIREIIEKVYVPIKR
ncbi:AAA family ATPase [Priestia koreensis]|uniref:AAA family ATPase n=1 Tax=Priestia koreensis TaxID=284581 RepID=A0A0M0KV64_9BACI|nr:MoxR family ATPase [Priestia koreensis]KOO42293.1 AAA family ATPase [Priestia koreensis]